MRLKIYKYNDVINLVMFEIFSRSITNPSFVITKQNVNPTLKLKK